MAFLGIQPVRAKIIGNEKINPTYQHF